MFQPFRESRYYGDFLNGMNTITELYKTLKVIDSLKTPLKETKIMQNKNRPLDTLTLVGMKQV